MTQDNSKTTAPAQDEAGAERPAHSGLTAKAPADTAGISSQQISVRSRLFTGAIWISAAKAISLLVSFFSTVLLARLLVPDDFGLVAIAMAVSYMAAALTEMSLAQALIQHDNPEEGHFHTAFTMNLINATITALALALVSVPLASFYGDSRLAEIVLVLACSSLISGLINPKMINFERELDFRQGVIIGLAEKLTAFVVAATAAFVFRSYWALILSILASQVARVTISYLMVRYRPRFSLSHWRDLMSFSVWVTLSRWVQTMNWRSEPLILGYFVPTARLGHLEMADRVSKMTVGELTAPLTLLLFPTFSRLRSDPARFRAAYLHAQASLCLIVFPTAIGMALLAEPAVELLIGEKWLPAVPLLQILAIMVVILDAGRIHPVAMALGKTRVLFHRDVRALLIRMPLMVAGIFLGASTGLGILVGALLGRGVAVTINQVWNMQVISKISTISLRDQFAILLRPTLAVLLMVDAVLLAKVALLRIVPDASSLLQLLVLPAVGAATYLISVLLIWLIQGRPNGPEKEALDLVMTKIFGRHRMA